jgi:cytochrome oxidase Cu insertion factor (SCO1/SenC/PrrC family)
MSLPRKRRLELFTKKIWLLAIIGIILLSSCAQPAPPAAEPVPSATSAWMDIELTDVATGQTFTIGDFKGKPILLESFAVWCPTCLSQQKEIDKVLASESDDIIHISLDTDPNEDEAKVKEHLERYGFNWYFAIAPIEITEALIDDFGLNIVSAPRAPVVLICEDQSTRFLRSGVKPVEELLSEIDKGCQ